MLSINLINKIEKKIKTIIVSKHIKNKKEHLNILLSDKIINKEQIFEILNEGKEIQILGFSDTETNTMYLFSKDEFIIFLKNFEENKDSIY